MLKHGDRAGAIWRLDDRRRIIAVAGYGAYAGEDRDDSKPMFGFMDSTIISDDGTEIDVDFCHSWGEETTVKKTVEEYQKRGFRVMTLKDFKKEPEAKRVRHLF